MTIYSQLWIGGSLVNDVNNYNVNRSIGENNQASSFTANIENYSGRNAGSYTVGNEVIVYADKDVNPPVTKIFTGILEDIKYSGKEEREKIILTGRDYTARLMDRTIEPEIYTSLFAGSIVKDVVSKYVDNITTGSYVNDSPTIIDRITFSHTPVFDAIKKLADLADYTFYVDENKNLHFVEKEGSSSGYTFNNTNVIKSEFKELRDTIYNQVWVYGDRYLDGYKETFTANGGSIFTLLYNPHNTNLTVGGSVIQPGGVLGMTNVAVSGVMYLVGYDDKQIVFVSGTSTGNFIPTSGNSVVVTYDRSLPIVKVGDNEESKLKYGTRVKVIQDKDIKDPATAEQILLRELDKSSLPKKEGKLNIKGIVDVIPGTTCIVNVTPHNITNQTYDILEVNYDFDKERNLSEEVLSLKVNKKIPDITDTMKDLILGLKKLQAADITTSDIITRFQYATGSVGIRQSGVLVYESNVTGSAYHLYSTNFTPPTNPFHLASGTNQGFLSGSPVGSAFGPFTISWSGGYL